MRIDPAEMNSLEDQALIAVILGDWDSSDTACLFGMAPHCEVGSPAQVDWDEHSKEMAWEVLMKRHYYSVKKVLVSYAGFFSDLDDVLLMSFFKAYRGLKSLEEPSKFKYWIRAIALNECREHVSERNGFHRVKSGSELIPIPEMEAAEKPVEAVENAMLLEELKSRIPQKYWQVLFLRYFHGYSVNEVSDLLGISTGLVKWRTNRGKKLAKEFLRTK